jgi:DNA-binding NtrC family response regulator
MVALCDGGVIGPDAFVAEAAPAPATEDFGDQDALPPRGNEGLSLREQLDAVERTIIVTMLAVTHGNRTKAARRLGVGRTCFLDRLKKHGLM